MFEGAATGEMVRESMRCTTSKSNTRSVWLTGLRDRSLWLLGPVRQTLGGIGLSRLAGANDEPTQATLAACLACLPSLGSTLTGSDFDASRDAKALEARVHKAQVHPVTEHRGWSPNFQWVSPRRGSPCRCKPTPAVAVHPCCCCSQLTSCPWE